MNAARFDAAEIARFNALAETWWDPEGPMKPLHRINPVRLKWFKRVLADHFKRDEAALRPFEGLRLLDVGCGGGLVTEPMARMGFAATGIDLAEKNVEAAKIHAEKSGVAVTYAVRAIEEVPQDEAVDCLCLLEVVEHVPDVAAMVKEAAQRIRPGGILLASTLNRTLKAYALAIVGAEYVLRWLPKGTHEWKKFVTPEELSDAMREAGLIPLAPEGMVFNPLTNSWKMSHDCEVNYYMAAIKP